MSKTGKIIIIEDDSDDKNILEMVIREIGITNEFKWFKLAEDAMKYLCETEDTVFIMFCDINLPKMNGLEFKKIVDDTPALRKKSIPFVFYSTTANQASVNEAYTDMTVQGFFKKDHDYSQIKKTMQIIFEYWMACRYPNF